MIYLSNKGISIQSVSDFESKSMQPLQRRFSRGTDFYVWDHRWNKFPSVEDVEVRAVTKEPRKLNLRECQSTAPFK